MFCVCQPPTLETQLHFCALHHSALQAPAACPTTPSWASWQGLALRWSECVSFIHQRSFLKISVSKQKIRIILSLPHVMNLNLCWITFPFVTIESSFLSAKWTPPAEISFHRLPFRWEGRPLCAQAPVQKASFHHAVPSPVASYSLVPSSWYFYICVPFIQLFTNLILNLFLY